MAILDKSIKALLLVITLQGCSTPYYGYTKRDWNRLSAEEQDAVKAEYQEIVDFKRGQAHDDTLDARTQSIIDYAVDGPKYGKFP